MPAPAQSCSRPRSHGPTPAQSCPRLTRPPAAAPVRPPRVCVIAPAVMPTPAQTGVWPGVLEQCGQSCPRPTRPARCRASSSSPRMRHRARGPFARRGHRNTLTSSSALRPVDNLACRPQAANCSFIDRPHPARCSHVPPEHHHPPEGLGRLRPPGARGAGPACAHSAVARRPVEAPARSRRPAVVFPVTVPACARRSIADRRPAPGLSRRRPPARSPPQPGSAAAGARFRRSRPTGSTAGAANSHPSPGRGRAQPPDPDHPAFPLRRQGPRKEAPRKVPPTCARGGRTSLPVRPPSTGTVQNTSTTVPVDPLGALVRRLR